MYAAKFHHDLAAPLILSSLISSMFGGKADINKLATDLMIGFSDQPKPKKKRPPKDRSRVMT